MILFSAAVALGLAAVVIGFREVLRPAQQQRVIDQLPFMSLLRRPTPMGGVFPTLVSAEAAEDALALLDMPLDFASPAAPTGIETPVAVVEAQSSAATALPAPTIAPTATVTATPAPTATSSPPPPTRPPANGPPAAARIFGIRHQQQTWNNCGPATITMALSYYGWQQDQAFAAARLRPNREDKNVSPGELARFVEEETDLRAIVRMGGTLDLLKTLVAREFPVVIETAAMFEAYDWIGHYRALVAYDDAYERFYFFDSFLGVGEGAQGVASSYAEVDANWRAFNRTFIVIYEPQREALLRELLAERWDQKKAASLAFETARLEARQNRQDAFAWFNMGTALVALERYEEAAAAFDRANSVELPWRFHWYQFGAFEAYFQVGRYDDVLTLVKINQNSAPELEEPWYWRGRVQEAQGQAGAAAGSYRQALAYNPHYDEARAALARLQ